MSAQNHPARPIAVVGPGAMGCLFGARLAAAGESVVLVPRTPDEAATLRERGVRLWEGERLQKVPLAVETDPAVLGPAQLVLIFVKAHQTRSALDMVRALTDRETQVLTLQNGLGSADLLVEAVKPEQLRVGTTAQGATRLGTGEIRHGGHGPTRIGPYRGGGDSLDLCGRFGRAGLATQWLADPWPALWHKLAVNCGINALTALLGVKNGHLATIEPARELLREAVLEVAAVAAAREIPLESGPDLVDQALRVAQATADNRSSMGQDVDRRSRTEVEFINGAAVREGERVAVPTPVNRTLTRLIRALEATF